MKRLILFILIILILLAAAGAVLFFWLQRQQPLAASGPISAPKVAALPGATIFQIVPEESEARFIIDEVLRGVPTTVVGVTNQIAGTISVDRANLAQTTAGTMRVNARTLATDSDRRNGAINRFILNTDQFEFIEYTPTSLTGLPTQITLGQSFTIQSSGNLTIRDISQPVSFEITVTPVSETRLEAQAKTTLKRGDFNLTIPSVPFVADVSEEVQLEIDFVAEAKP